MRRLNRRAFLKAGGAGSLAAAAAIHGRPLHGRSLQTPPAGSRTADVAVVGAGAFGAWTALVLRERGVGVTLVDAYGPGSPRATSGGETRQIRVGYGDREMYSRWVLRAFERWELRQQEWNRRLLFRTGRLQLFDRRTPGLDVQQKIFDGLRVGYEVLPHDDLVRRYPQMAFDGVELGLLEPDAAVIKAREAVLAVAEAFERKGGTLEIARAVPGGAEGRRLAAVELGPAGRLSAGTFVFACGPWLRTLFPDVLGRTISTPRREVFFVGTPAGDARYSWPHMPNWSEPTYYGFPSIEHKGVKVCPVGGSIETDPDTDDRVVSPHQVRRAYDYVGRRFPGLAGQPIVETRVCQLENTPDEHFLIDRHPAFDNVWIAGGGSGHGFKHGPVVGEYIADCALGRPGDPDLARLFRLERTAG